MVTPSLYAAWKVTPFLIQCMCTLRRSFYKLELLERCFSAFDTYAILWEWFSTLKCVYLDRWIFVLAYQAADTKLCSTGALPQLVFDCCFALHSIRFQWYITVAVNIMVGGKKQSRAHSKPTAICMMLSVICNYNSSVLVLTVIPSFNMCSIDSFDENLPPRVVVFTLLLVDWSIKYYPSHICSDWSFDNCWFISDYPTHQKVHQVR